MIFPFSYKLPALCFVPPGICHLRGVLYISIASNNRLLVCSHDPPNCSWNDERWRHDSCWALHGSDSCTLISWHENHVFHVESLESQASLARGNALLRMRSGSKQHNTPVHSSNPILPISSTDLDYLADMFRCFRHRIRAFPARKTLLSVVVKAEMFGGGAMGISSARRSSASTCARRLYTTFALIYSFNK